MAAALVIAGANATALAADPEIGSAIGFRTAFGLRADPAYVRSVALDSGSSSERWDVPLTAAEEAEMARRTSFQEDLDGLLAVGSSRADIFGGLRIDQPAGGVIDIALTTDTLANRALFASVAPPGSTIRFRTVTRTQRQLDETA
jgi:hypothetical protein